MASTATPLQLTVPNMTETRDTLLLSAWGSLPHFVVGMEPNCAKSR